MDTDDHPLLQLSPEKQRDLANLVEDDLIADVAAETGYSRRRILGVLATLGTGAAVGGFTLEELVGVVEAGADTDDGDGNVGHSSNRVDVFADGVDATSVRTSSVNNEVYAKNFDGGDLSEKVENALSFIEDELAEKGRLRITPKDDGSTWEWGNDVVVDVSERSTVEIDVDANVEVEYTGSGWALTLDQKGEYRDNISAFRLVGGKWTLPNGSDASGWLRMMDVTLSCVAPTDVDYSTCNGTVAISVENHDRWSEMNHISGTNISADTCVEYVSVDETGGSGSNSFHGNRISTRRMATAADGGTCVRFGAGMSYGKVDNTQFFLHGDDAYALDLDGKFSGCTFDSIKVEGHATGGTAVRFSGDYDRFYGPMFLNCHILHPDNLAEDDGADVAGAPNFVADRNHGIKVYDLMDKEMNGTDADINLISESNHTWHVEGPSHRFSGTVDVTELPDWGGAARSIRYHDGSGALPEGPAFFDGTNWISLVDGTSTA